MYIYIYQLKKRGRSFTYNVENKKYVENTKDRLTATL